MFTALARRSLACSNRALRHLSQNVNIDQHTLELTKILGAQNVQTEELESYNQDWIGSHKGKQCSSSNLLHMFARLQETQSWLFFPVPRWNFPT